MADLEQFKILKQGSKVWNQWRNDTQILPNLSRSNLSAANLSEVDLSGAILNEVDFSGANLHDANFIGADLHDANFIGADLTRANLSEASLGKADLRGAILNEAILRGAILNDTILIEANLDKANLSGAVFSSADLNSASLRKADLRRADFIRTNLCRVDLSDADLRWAIFKKSKDVMYGRVDLSGADLSRANLSEADLRGAYLNGAKLKWATLNKANLEGVVLREANLIGADLKRANLIGADLRRTNLSGAIIQKTNLIGVNLSKANINNADLTGAVLIGATLKGAYLIGSNLSEANLSEANFIAASLNGAEFSQAIFDKTFFSSRTDIFNLRFPLTDEQKAGIIFYDEREEAENKRKDKQLKNYPFLKIIFQDKVSWKNEWLAFLLMAIQVTYNNCFYLSTTEDIDIKTIKENLEKKCQVSAKNDIELKIIQQHSPLELQYVQYAVENAPQVAKVLSFMAGLILAITKSYKMFREGKKAKAEEDKIKIETEKEQFALDIQKGEYIHIEAFKDVKKELEKVDIPTSNKIILDNKVELLTIASKDLQIVLGALNITANIRNILVKMDELDSM